ncbi:MAG: ABC transporter permease subunit, partial [Rhodospirillales bacterium]|nr:ABC transporter permease subunit [Rhodospirillales bacterium]
ATSGERERGSLEPLLINPVSRWALMLGKFLAALFFTAMAVVVQLTAFKLIFTFVGGDAQAFENTLRPMALLAMFFMALPLMMVAVGVQLMIATVTRSFKEAQTYFGLLPLVPAIPGMAMVFSPVQTQKWMMTIPIFSQTLIMGQYVRDEDVELINLAYSASFTGLLALVLIYISSRLYERENLISAAELSISWATSFRL